VPNDSTAKKRPLKGKEEYKATHDDSINASVNIKDIGIEMPMRLSDVGLGAADMEDNIKKETGMLSQTKKIPSDKPRFVKSCCNAIRFQHRFLSIFYKFKASNIRTLTALTFGFQMFFIAFMITEIITKYEYKDWGIPVGATFIIMLLVRGLTIFL
jgi:hypothetical protein